MSDVVMWVKFKVNMYEDTKLKIIDSEDKRNLYHYIWARSIVLAGKINLGRYLYITENIPHTIKTLAIEFNRNVEEVKDAFKILRKLEMIELTEDKVFKIKNWEKHQNVEGMERAKQLNINRVAKCRAKKKAANDNGEGEIKLKALELIQYHEKITGKVGGCDYVALRAAIDIHGVKWVKMAMDVGFEKNCPDIKYAIGILKNWRRKGYPEENMEVKKNGVRSTGTSNTADKNEFAGFKPKEPRKLTEAQRKWAEENLI
ncbi:phage replisome organizer N-terminal domain-containing protein [Clostridium saccharoperbutylacetonicum]|uniref:phage replisome organizer N-terminal domain-containing protein n=1 Tax=Clostridium saccharoperbutylacetonicum TaxID=36745 RepID=UPI0039E73F15